MLWTGVILLAEGDMLLTMDHAETDVLEIHLVPERFVSVWRLRQGIRGTNAAVIHCATSL